MLKAENEFKAAVKIQPDSEEAVTTLAYLYNEEGDSNRALRGSERRSRNTRVPPSSTRRWATPTSSRRNTSRPSRPIGKSTELDHDNLDAVRGLAQNLMNDGQTEAALEQYKAIVDADPSDAQTYMRIAEI